MAEYVKDSEYLPQMYKMLCAIEENEAEAMNRAAQAIYASLQKGGILHVFATGHSHMIADELFYRSGGLAPVNPLLVSDIMVYEGAVHSTLVERQSGVAKRILDKFELRAGDCLLIASNSGINIAAIEAAELAKERGLTVICVTSVKTSRALVSRHPEGKKLYQVGDIIIDNHSPEGDGLLEVPQNGQRTHVRDSVYRPAYCAEGREPVYRAGRDSPCVPQCQHPRRRRVQPGTHRAV